MRTRLTTRLAAVLVTLVIAGAAGCGGDDDDDESAAGRSTTTTTEGGSGRDDGNGDDGDKVDAEEWTRSLCTELGTWQDELESLGADLATELEDVSGPEAARDTLVGFIDDAIGATDQMLAGVETIGSPDIDDGDAIASEVRDGLAEVRQVFIDGRERAQELPVDDPLAFQEGAQELGNDLTAAGEEIQANFEELESEYDVPELDRAFDEEPACQSITS